MRIQLVPLDERQRVEPLCRMSADEVQRLVYPVLPDMALAGDPIVGEYAVAVEYATIADRGRLAAYEAELYLRLREHAQRIVPAGIPVEIRSKLPFDFGRCRGMAWIIHRLPPATAAYRAQAPAT